MPLSTCVLHPVGNHRTQNIRGSYWSDKQSSLSHKVQNYRKKSFLRSFHAALSKKLNVKKMNLFIVFALKMRVGTFSTFLRHFSSPPDPGNVWTLKNTIWSNFQSIFDSDLRTCWCNRKIANLALKKWPSIWTWK